MPRKPRKKSNTGIYHAMLRGINGQPIFLDREDYERLILTLEKYKEISKYEIYAYCIMKNHMHLLLREGTEDLGITFKRIGASYVYWYNAKYGRTGHLFQDRYRSEPIEDERYFLTVVRYIHQNPLKAGIVKGVGEYQWSSYNEYIRKEGICNVQYVLSIFSRDKKRAIGLFEEFNSIDNDDKCLEYEEQTRINDIEAKKIIKKLTGVANTKEVQKFNRASREKAIKMFKNNGLSIRQIERLTGIGFNIIKKI